MKGHHVQESIRNDEGRMIFGWTDVKSDEALESKMESMMSTENRI